MKLTPHQHKLYDTFYESTVNDTVLDEKTELLVGLSAAMALNCQPCMAYYVARCQKADVPRAEMQAVLAKVMAVAAGQKRLQAEQVLRDFDLDF